MIILPTAYFPDTNYLALLKHHGEAVIDLGEHFRKQTVRNRTIMLGANGIMKLIVPLKKWHNHTPVKDVRISYAENWQKIHWKSIESAYRKSPYFEYYEPQLHHLIFKERYDFLKDLNRSVLAFIVRQMQLEVNITESELYMENTSDKNDFRGLEENHGYRSTQPATYFQVFATGKEFIPHLGALDLICNAGPNSIHLLERKLS